MVRHWHEFVGYAIQPRRDIASFWLLIGHGSNGKSKLIETIQNLVGSDAVLNDQIASFQRDRFNIPALAGKLLFIDDDMASDTRLDDGLLKKISEAKEMSARHAYGERKFKFRCLALPIMVGNSYPTTTDTSHGLRRRAMVIPFDKRFEGDADQHLFSKIWSTEMSGILNRTLQGLKRLRQRGGFKLPVDCEKAFQDFMVHANPFIAFVEEECQRASDARVYLRDFRAALKVWAVQEGVKGPLPGHGLKRQLEGLGFKVAMHDGKNRVSGLELRSPSTEVD
jgi:putative DNA primase/helicase